MFVWGFLLHALHNAVFVGIGILHVSAFGNNKYRNPFYSIKIEETNDSMIPVPLKKLP
jgi:hypothetical protein